MNIELKAGFYELSFAYRPSIVNYIKDIPGKRYDGQRKIWTVPASERVHLERIAYKIRQFEPVTWGGSATEEEKIFAIPKLPTLQCDHGLKINPYPYQLQGIARGLELKRFMNCDEPGLGKAQTLYSKVASPLGWRAMGELSIGDNVFAKDGTIQQVIGVFPQGIQETYLVTMNDNSTCECNLEHIWCVRDQNRRRRRTGWINMTLKEILDSGLTHTSNTKRAASGRKPALKWEIPMCSPVMYSTKQYVIHPYILGVLIGDGALTQNTICFSTPDFDHEIVDRVAALLPSHLKLRVDRHPGCPQYYITQTNTTSKNSFKCEVERLGLNVKSPVRSIPQEYLFGAIEQRIELLRGLMDTDGTAKNNRITFCTKSEMLTNAITELVESLGGQTIIRSYDRGIKGVEYQVAIRIDICPFHLTRKAKEFKARRHGVSRYIKSVEYIGDFEQQCIKVSSPDHLYLTDSYIVTHNTLQSIATINIAGAFPCLVICPSSLKINWEREWSKFTNKKAMVLTDKVRDTWPFFWQTGMYQVFIVNYESLKKYFVQRIKKSEGWRLSDVEFRNTIELFKSVIIDESHRCKSASTQQAKFCKGICSGKEYVIELTGTPVVNRPKDLIPQLAILNRLDDFGGYKHFVSRYCAGQSEASNLKELNFMLWDKSMFRREKSLVLTDLPDKIRQVNTCEITNRKEYQDAERDLITYLQRYKDADDEKIQRALRGEVLFKINALRNITARGKVRDVVEFVKDFRENGQKIILFCSLHEVVDQLKHHFPTAVSVTGRDSQDEKQRAVDSFQNNPKTDIIICSIKAAGVGLTLTASSNVAFVEFPWTYADCCQCEDRAHRIGQKSSVTCYYFLGRQTIDSKVYDIIQTKKKIANSVTGNSDDIEENIVDMVANLFNEDHNNSN